MTTQEQRELDAWIAEHVIGWMLDVPKRYNKGTPSIEFWNCGSTSRLVADWKPTTDPAASREVERKCLEKCGGVRLSFHNGNYYIRKDEGYGPIHETNGETLEIMWALFAKKIYA